MRISEAEKKGFIELCRKHFGESSHLYLFGSRVDDQKKGGDIDLFLDASEVINLQQQLNFLVDVEKKLTSRKIDLIIHSPESRARSIFDTARRTGVLLC